MAECSTTLEYDIEEEMMERLTEKHEADAQRKEYERRLANGYPRNIPEERFLRLAAYEDTGLEPEEVDKLAKDWSDLCTIVGECGGISRLREVAEADKDGRVVVLPCKVGDKLYRVFAGEIFEHRVGSMKYFAIQGQWDIETYPFCPCVESSIGKTIFLTREEAEKALEATEK